jgi:integrase
MNRRIRKQTDESTAPIFGSDLDGTLVALLEDYLGSRDLDASLSEESKESYRQMWRAVRAFCVRYDFHVCELSVDQLQLLIDLRGKEAVSKASLTVRYAWRLLRLIEEVAGFEAARTGAPRATAASELIDKDYRFVNARNKDALPDTITRQEYARLMGYLMELWPRRALSEVSAADRKDARNRAVLAVMLGAGLTPREVTELKVDNIFLDEKGLPATLRVQALGRSPARDVPIAGWSAQVLSAWLAIRARAFADAAEPLRRAFPSNSKDRGMDNSTINQGFHGALEACRISSSPRGAAGKDSGNVATRGPFTLRHTFAVKARSDNTYTDEALMTILGYADAKSFQRYKRVIF